LNATTSDELGIFKEQNKGIALGDAWMDTLPYFQNSNLEGVNRTNPATLFLVSIQRDGCDW
jgi:hypothetical protein